MAQPPVELLFGPHFKGAPRTDVDPTNPWSGRTTVDSGTVQVTVSSTLIRSDSIIVAGEEVSSVGVASVQSAGHIVVNSIVDGVSFALARAGGVAAPWDAIAHWLLWNQQL